MPPAVEVVGRWRMSEALTRSAGHVALGSRPRSQAPEEVEPVWFELLVAFFGGLRWFLSTPETRQRPPTPDAAGESQTTPEAEPTRELTADDLMTFDGAAHTTIAVEEQPRIHDAPPECAEVSALESPKSSEPTRELTADHLITLDPAACATIAVHEQPRIHDAPLECAEVSALDSPGGSDSLDEPVYRDLKRATRAELLRDQHSPLKGHRDWSLMIAQVVGALAAFYPNFEETGDSFVRYMWCPYVDLVHLAICALSAYSAYAAGARRRTGWAWLFGAMAVVYNPFVRVRMPDGDWYALDAFVSLVFFISAPLVIFRDGKEQAEKHAASEATPAGSSPAPGTTKTLQDMGRSWAA
jgi:uncharacterized protein DUF6804